MSACPFCAEALEGEPGRCPTCGEALEPPRVRRVVGGGTACRTVLVTLAVVVAVLLTVAFLGALRAYQAVQASRPRCGNNLRMLGIGALMYADDHGGYPHVGPPQELDGDVGSDHAPRIVRALVYYGYTEDPEGFICEASRDEAAEQSPVALANPKRWFWHGGATSDISRSPFVDGLADPPLSATTELSYGWTRRTLTRNASSNVALAADRAVALPGADPADPLYGNHSEGWNVLRADASVSFRPASRAAAATLVGVGPNDDALGIKDQAADRELPR